MKNGLEQIIGVEAFRFVKKDRTKLKLVLGLYGVSLKDREMGKLTRASYFFARHLDDLLDGEASGVGNPREYALSLRDQVETGVFDPTMPISRLVEFALPQLERRAKPNDNPRQEFTTLIDSMLFDHDRRQDRRVLSGEELKAYYSGVLNFGFEIMFIGFGSELRTSNIPNYSPNLGRLYSVRDMAKDWSVGIINVPEEVLSGAGLMPSSPYEEVAVNRELQDWTGQEVSEATAGMRTAQQALAEYPRDLSARVLNGLARSAMKAVI